MLILTLPLPGAISADLLFLSFLLFSPPHILSCFIMPRAGLGIFLITPASRWYLDMDRSVFCKCTSVFLYFSPILGLIFVKCAWVADHRKIFCYLSFHTCLFTYASSITTCNSAFSENWIFLFNTFNQSLSFQMQMYKKAKLCSRWSVFQIVRN